ncbi:hypothetical protein C8R47DRAFT_95930 [Mycena vitilis]|nr:hypothetical protein C8R47DRAFT_95930 [Mycena vitilis]
MSGQPTAMDGLPQEMWLRIFGLVDNAKTLGCVVLVSHKFHALGTEALVRHIKWRSPAVAVSHLEFWDRNPSKTHLVRSVSLSLGRGSSDVNDDFPRIFGCIQSFSRLQHLRLACGKVPSVLYSTLQYLPSVTNLTLHSCAIPPPPPFFPLSYHSPIPPTPIQVTILKISKLRPSHIGNFILDAVTLPIAHALPNLQAFDTDAIGIQIPSDVSARLSSLTISLHGVAGDIQPRLDALLHRMPALRHLDVSVANGHPAHSEAANADPHPSPPLPELRTLSAPWPAAGHVLINAGALVHLRITSPIAKTNDALWLLERARDKPVRTAALRLHTWDDEVLLAAARCLPACESLEIVYQDGAPFEGFLFDLGIHHLPLLRALHTLRLFALPPADTSPQRFVWDATAGADGGGHVSGGEEEGTDDELQREGHEEADGEAAVALRECVHAWTRYNPALQLVQLGTQEGRTWVRRQGLRWDATVEDEGQRAEVWERVCTGD